MRGTEIGAIKLHKHGKPVKLWVVDHNAKASKYMPHQGKKEMARRAGKKWRIYAPDDNA